MRAIVLVLHGCPAGGLGAYGNERVGTPNLDRLAAEGVVFDRQIACCPDPAAARRAWRMGASQVAAVGLEDSTHPTSPEPPDLLALLRSANIRTAVVRAAREANDGPPPFYAGWDEVFDARPDTDAATGLDALARTLPGVLGKLGAAENFLLWIEADALLPPWDVPAEVFEAFVEDLLDEDDQLAVPEPWTNPAAGWFDTDDLPSWELLHRTYAAAVTTADASLGRLFDQMREAGLDRSAAWAVTSDFGFPLGQHGVLGRFRPHLHAELVHTPLIVRLPDAAHAGRRSDAFTQPADLFPTLLGLFGVPVPPGRDGFDLRPLWEGTKGNLRDTAVSTLTIGPAAELALRTREWTFLLPTAVAPDDDPREPKLYAQPDDGCEANDVRSRHLELADELEARLRAASGERPA